MVKDQKFRKDFTAEQYAAYLERKAKNPEAFIPEPKASPNQKNKTKKTE